MLCLLPWKKRFDHRLFTEVDAYLFIPSGRHQFVCVTMFLVLFYSFGFRPSLHSCCLNTLPGRTFEFRFSREAFHIWHSGLACFLHVCFCAGFAITLSLHATQTHARVVYTREYMQRDVPSWVSPHTGSCLCVSSLLTSSTLIYSQIMSGALRSACALWWKVDSIQAHAHCWWAPK